MIKEKEIIRAACGVNEEQESNSIIRVETKILHLSEGGSEEPLSDLTLDTPIVNIHRSFRYTMIDLQFDSENDQDFILLSEMLRDFTGTEQSMDVEKDRIPVLVVTVMPKAYDGEYFICGMHGIWCLMPSGTGKFMDTVRFIFDNELVYVFQINPDALESDDEEGEYDETEYDETENDGTEDDETMDDGEGIGLGIHVKSPKSYSYEDTAIVSADDDNNEEEISSSDETEEEDHEDA